LPWSQVKVLRDRYPAMIATWESAWGEFAPFLEFPLELRQIVYTTNAVESLNARFRKAVRHRAHFPTEQAALKVLFLVATEKRPNRSNPTGKINGWKKILNTWTIHYGDRVRPPTNHEHHDRLRNASECHRESAGALGQRVTIRFLRLLLTPQTCGRVPVVRRVVASVGPAGALLS
jgi:hypothetical protein